MDFSDGLGTPTQLFIKNNHIIRILPGYDKVSQKTNWISDKTRFSFDGMFSPEKIIYNFLENGGKKSFINLSWQKLFKEFFCTLYFQSHLLKHYYQPYPIMMLLGKNTSLEVLNLLNVLTRKYSFFKLRRVDSQSVSVDLEQNYLLDLNLNNKIAISDTCWLIGINPRYEGSRLNLRLRSRYLQGNFKIIQIGSLLNLTFPNVNITSNTKILKSLVEGNNLFCQEFVNSLNPILISNAQIFKRKDSFGFANLLNFLSKHINLFSQSDGKSQLNILHPSLGSVGFLNFTSLKPVQNKDLKNAAGVYFVNNSFSNYNVKKLLNLKLLNFFQDHVHENKILITQNSSLDTKLITELKKGFN